MITIKILEAYIATVFNSNDNSWRYCALAYLQPCISLSLLWFHVKVFFCTKAAGVRLSCTVYKANMFVCSSEKSLSNFYVQITGVGQINKNVIFGSFSL